MLLLHISAHRGRKCKWRESFHPILEDLIAEGILRGPLANAHCWDVHIKNPPANLDELLNSELEGNSHSLSMALAGLAATADCLDASLGCTRKLARWVCTGIVNSQGAVDGVGGLGPKLRAAIEQQPDTENDLQRAGLPVRGKLAMMMPRCNEDRLETIAALGDQTFHLSREGGEGHWLLWDADRTRCLPMYLVDSLDEAADLAFGQSVASAARARVEQWCSHRDSCRRRRQLVKRLLRWVVVPAVLACLIGVAYFLGRKLLAEPEQIAGVNWNRGNRALTLIGHDGGEYTWAFSSPIRHVLFLKPPVGSAFVALGKTGEDHGRVYRFDRVGRPRLFFNCNRKGPYYAAKIGMGAEVLLSLSTMARCPRILVVANGRMVKQSLLQLLDEGRPAGHAWVEGEVQAAVYVPKEDLIVLAGTSAALSRTRLAQRTDRHLGFLAAVAPAQLAGLRLDDPDRPTSAAWWKVIYPHGEFIEALSLEEMGASRVCVAAQTDSGRTFFIRPSGKLTPAQPRHAVAPRVGTAAAVRFEDIVRSPSAARARVQRTPRARKTPASGAAGQERPHGL